MTFTLTLSTSSKTALQEEKGSIKMLNIIEKTGWEAEVA